MNKPSSKANVSLLHTRKRTASLYYIGHSDPIQEPLQCTCVCLHHGYTEWPTDYSSV